MKKKKKWVILSMIVAVIICLTACNDEMEDELEARRLEEKRTEAQKVDRSEEELLVISNSIIDVPENTSVSQDTSVVETMPEEVEPETSATEETKPQETEPQETEPQESEAEEPETLGTWKLIGTNISVPENYEDGTGYRYTFSYEEIDEEHIQFTQIGGYYSSYRWDTSDQYFLFSKPAVSFEPGASVSLTAQIKLDNVDLDTKNCRYADSEYGYFQINEPGLTDFSGGAIVDLADENGEVYLELSESDKMNATAYPLIKTMVVSAAMPSEANAGDLISVYVIVKHDSYGRFMFCEWQYEYQK